MATFTSLSAAAGLLVLAGGWATVQAQELPTVPSSAAATSNVARPKLPQYVRLQVGTVPTMTWTYPCARLGLEYAPMLTKHLGLAGRLIGVAGRPTGQNGPDGPWIKQVPNQNYQAGFVEAEALLYPFGVSRRVRFAVGLGGFTGYYKQNAFSWVNVVSNQVQGYGLASYQGYITGYLGSLNLEVALGKQRAWAVGVKVMRQQGSGGITNLPGQSLTLARQL